MAHPFWNDWYFGWGWILWFGFIFLMFSGFGNWGYTYQAHRKYSGQSRGEPLDILNERYARGDISREDYGRLKTDIYGKAVPWAGSAGKHATTELGTA